MITECSVLLVGLFIGGPVFIFTFVFTFIQSPIFQITYLKLGDFVLRVEYKQKNRAKRRRIS